MYVKFAQILILNIVCKNSINGLQCYSLRIFISPCYGWDTSNGSWGLFLVFFGLAPLKPHHVEPYEAAELWHQNIATQSVIKLYSTILCESVGQWILFGVSSWNLALEATWFLHDSQLCGNPKLIHAATQDALRPIEQWLLQSWKNKKSFLYLTIWKKGKKRKRKKALKFLVAAREYDDCNRFWSGTGGYLV